MPSSTIATGPSFRMTKLVIALVCICCAIFVGWQFVSGETQRSSGQSQPAHVDQLLEANLVSQVEVPQVKVAVERRKRLSETTKRLLEWGHTSPVQPLGMDTRVETRPDLALDSDAVTESKPEQIREKQSEAFNERPKDFPAAKNVSDAPRWPTVEAAEAIEPSVPAKSPLNGDSVVEQPKSEFTAVVEEVHPGLQKIEPQSHTQPATDAVRSNLVPVSDAGETDETKHNAAATAAATEETTSVPETTEEQETTKSDVETTGLTIAHRADGAAGIVLRIDGKTTRIPTEGKIELKGSGPWNVQFMNGSTPASPVASLPAGNYSIGMSGGNFQMRRGN